MLLDPLLDSLLVLTMWDLIKAGMLLVNARFFHWINRSASYLFRTAGFIWWRLVPQQYDVELITEAAKCRGCKVGSFPHQKIIRNESRPRFFSCLQSKSTIVPLFALLCIQAFQRLADALAF